MKRSAMWFPAEDPIGGDTTSSGRRGVKGKIVEKKVDELRDYIDRAGVRVSRYVRQPSTRRAERSEALTSRPNLNGPEDAVTPSASFSSLDDGASFLE